MFRTGFGHNFRGEEEIGRWPAGTAGDFGWNFSVKSGPIARPSVGVRTDTQPAQVAGMSTRTTQSARFAAAEAATPPVRLDVRQGSGPATTYPVHDAGFLIGSVPGCDLRLPGKDLPAVLCLITPGPGGAQLRKLAPTQVLLLNGKTAANGTLGNGDRLTVGSVDLFVHIDKRHEALPAALPPVDRKSAELLQTLQEQQQALAALAVQLDQRQRQLEEQARDLEADRVVWYQRREQIERECAAKLQPTPPAPDSQVEAALKDICVREAALAPRLEKISEREAALAHRLDKVSERETALAHRLEDVSRREKSMEGARKELGDREAVHKDISEREVALAHRLEEVGRREKTVEAARKELVDREFALAHRLQELAQLEKTLAAREITLAHQLDEAGRQEKGLAAAGQDLAQREASVAQLREEFQARETWAAGIDRHQQELMATRQELADLRQQLYDRYQERRDRLAGLQEAVNRAARKVQDQKRELERERQVWGQQRTQDEEQHAALDTRAAELVERKQQLDDERNRFQLRRAELEQDVAAKRAECLALQAELVADRQAVEKLQAQYQADVLRLDRRQGDLEAREKELQAKEQHSEDKRQQLQRDSADLEGQILETENWRAELAAEKEQLASQKSAQSAQAQQLAQRAAALESQQATLAALRTRMERLREELRQQEQQLAEERSRQEKVQEDLRNEEQHLKERRAELDADQKIQEQERRQLVERSAVLEAAVHQLRQAQDKLAGDETALKNRDQELTAWAGRLTEQEGILTGRLAQLEQSQQRLEAERQAVRERTAALAQAEQVRETLQEQLRRRGEELASRQRILAEQFQQVKAQAAEWEIRRAELEQQQQETHKHLTAWREQIQVQARDLEQRRAEMQEKEETLAGLFDKLKETGRHIGGLRKALAEERAGARAEHEQQQAALARARTDFDTHQRENLAQGEAQRQQSRAELEALRQEARELVHQLPDLEIRAGTALERLAAGRDQLREYLEEIHAYARQCQDDLEAVHKKVRADADRLGQQEQELRRLQDEHKLAVAAFRQHLIAWQGQWSDKKRLMSRDETRLEQRQAVVAEQARHIDATTQQLARQVEELKEQEKQVADRRQEVDHHLTDMREWYRRKLRELAGVGESEGSRQSPVGSPQPEAKGDAILEKGQTSGEDEEILPLATNRNILSLAGPADSADRKLGDLLQALELVDGDTLLALLVEARRQRRSLRQVLLTGGTVTLYQMALIEAGSIDALMLGPVRVIDRVRVTLRETLYRVFDPRRGQEAVLRHLAEAEMREPGHAEEFRQRFRQARLPHPRLAETYEVLDIAGRPAVLQQWLTGLACPDWPPLVSVPGVCFRLLNQAALGLAAIHDAGLVHGHLRDHLLLLTREGVLKICGLGEPPWLTNPPFPADATIAADLAALGQIVSAWCLPQAIRKGAKVRPLPDALVDVLDRLRAEDGEPSSVRGEPSSVRGEPSSVSCRVTPSYASAATLLEDLDRISAAIPANPEAWDRLLRHIRDHAAPEAVLRQSA